VYRGSNTDQTRTKSRDQLIPVVVSGISSMAITNGQVSSAGDEDSLGALRGVRGHPKLRGSVRSSTRGDTLITSVSASVITASNVYEPVGELG